MEGVGQNGGGVEVTRRMEAAEGEGTADADLWLDVEGTQTEAKQKRFKQLPEWGKGDTDDLSTSS